MRRALFVCLICLMLLPVGVVAQGRDYIGTGRLMNNDFYGGDGIEKDRWRTGSVVGSHVWGFGWDGDLPSRVGDILELRFRGEVISPSNLVTPAPSDRPYAASLSIGAHTQFQFQGTEFSLGADLVMTGPQTGLEHLQSAVHELLGINPPSAAVLAGQIPNGFHPTVSVEAGRTFALSETASFRPFVQGQAGIETFVRVGGDLTFGRVGRNDLLIRDSVTGQQYSAASGSDTGWVFNLGGTSRM